MKNGGLSSPQGRRRVERTPSNTELYRAATRVLELIIDSFDDAVLEGRLEEGLWRLYSVAREGGHVAVAEHVYLLYEYARALRVRATALRSRRGFSRARDRFLRDIAFILRAARSL